MRDWNFKHITEQTCSDCNALPVDLRVYQLHTNGFHNEKVEYSCGKTLHFSPNFMKISTVESCRKSVEFRTLINKRYNFVQSLMKHAEAFDVDAKFKDKVVNEIERFL